MANTLTMQNIIEYPILFSSEMVRAILDGRKTQTRRVVKPQPEGYDPSFDGEYWQFCADDFEENVPHSIDRKCPYGRPGDRLWVRETWNALAPEVLFNDAYAGGDHYFHHLPAHLRTRGNTDVLLYQADGREYLVGHADDEYGKEDLTAYEYASELPARWISPIYMPRWAARILLEITDVRVEQVQDISAEDAESEGIDLCWSLERQVDYYADWKEEMRDCFRDLWNEINGKRPGCTWKDNPFVWVVEFRRIENQEKDE